jgi:hypothetical protein
MCFTGLLPLRHAVGVRFLAALLALLCALACAPAAAVPVFTADAEGDKDAIAGRVGAEAAAKATWPARDASLQKGMPKASESVSEWARFMKSLRSFFGMANEDIEMPQAPKTVRVDPAFATNVLPGAFDVSARGGALPGVAADADQAHAQAAGRDLFRDLSRAAGGSAGVAAANPAANPAPQAAGERKPGEESNARQKSSDEQAGKSHSLEDIKPRDFAEPEVDKVQKTAEQKALEGMLFSQLVDQAKPWVIGLAGLFIFWQVIRLLIHVLQGSQMRAVRRAAEDAARAPRARR